MASGPRSAPLLKERRNATRTHEIAAIGHAHIDTRVAVAAGGDLRKCVIVATQLRLQERYPATARPAGGPAMRLDPGPRARALGAVQERVAAGQCARSAGT